MRIRSYLWILFMGLITTACTWSGSVESSKQTDHKDQALPSIVKAHPGHAPDGVIGDRRIRPGHYIQMDILATTRNFIQIWLPELCSYKGLDEPFFLLSSKDLYHLKPDTTSTGGISLSGKAGDDLEFTGTAEEFKYGLYLTVKYHNVSDRMLEEVSSSVCVQLTAAPDFRDPGLNNTYWYHRGAWDSIFHYSSLEQEGTERCRFFQAATQQEQDLPLIIVESSTGDHALGLIFRDATGVGGNHQMSTGCIHSDGDSYDIKPKGTATREGLLIIHPEGKEGVLEIAKAFYQEEQTGE